MQAKFTVADFKEDQVFSWMERQRSDHKNIQKFSLASIKVWCVLFSEQSTIRALHPVFIFTFCESCHPMGLRRSLLRTKPLRFLGTTSSGVQKKLQSFKYIVYIHTIHCLFLTVTCPCNRWCITGELNLCKMFISAFCHPNGFNCNFP